MDKDNVTRLRCPTFDDFQASFDAVAGQGANASADVMQRWLAEIKFMSTGCIAPQGANTSVPGVDPFIETGLAVIWCIDPENNFEPAPACPYADPYNELYCPTRAFLRALPKAARSDYNADATKGVGFPSCPSVPECSDGYEEIPCNIACVNADSRPVLASTHVERSTVASTLKRNPSISTVVELGLTCPPPFLVQLYSDVQAAKTQKPTASSYWAEEDTANHPLEGNYCDVNNPFMAKAVGSGPLDCNTDLISCSENADPFGCSVTNGWQETTESSIGSLGFSMQMKGPDYTWTSRLSLSPTAMVGETPLSLQDEAWADSDVDSSCHTVQKLPDPPNSNVTLTSASPPMMFGPVKPIPDMCPPLSLLLAAAKASVYGTDFVTTFWSCDASTNFRSGQPTFATSCATPVQSGGQTVSLYATWPASAGALPSCIKTVGWATADYAGSFSYSDTDSDKGCQAQNYGQAFFGQSSEELSPDMPMNPTLWKACTGSDSSDQAAFKTLNQRLAYVTRVRGWMNGVLLQKMADRVEPARVMSTTFVNLGFITNPTSAPSLTPFSNSVFPDVQLQPFAGSTGLTTDYFPQPPLGIFSSTVAGTAIDFADPSLTQGTYLRLTAKAQQTLRLVQIWQAVAAWLDAPVVNSSMWNTSYIPPFPPTVDLPPSVFEVPTSAKRLRTVSKRALFKAAAVFEWFKANATSFSEWFDDNCGDQTLQCIIPESAAGVLLAAAGNKWIIRPLVTSKWLNPSKFSKARFEYEDIFGETHLKYPSSWYEARLRTTWRINIWNGQKEGGKMSRGQRLYLEDHPNDPSSNLFTKWCKVQKRNLDANRAEALKKMSKEEMRIYRDQVQGEEVRVADKFDDAFDQLDADASDAFKRAFNIRDSSVGSSLSAEGSLSGKQSLASVRPIGNPRLSNSVAHASEQLEKSIGNRNEGLVDSLIDDEELLRLSEVTNEVVEEQVSGVHNANIEQELPKDAREVYVVAEPKVKEDGGVYHTISDIGDLNLEAKQLGDHPPLDGADSFIGDLVQDTSMYIEAI
jgi:hypothetical protein